MQSQNMQPENIANPILSDDQTSCPACGHFAGVYEICPRCGTYIPKRMAVKIFKYLSLVLSLAGLICVYLWVIHRQPETVKVGDITETMNFAYVRMGGKVTRDTRIFYDELKKPTYLTFSLADNTGEIRVMAYRHNAEKLVRLKKLPRRGDQAVVLGQLRVKADNNLSLMIQAVEQFELKRENPENIPLKDIGTSYLNKEINIRGKIAAIKVPGAESRAPVVISISQEQTRHQIVMWKDLYQKLTNLVTLQVGDVIAARVMVNEYRQRLQLRLKNPTDLKLVTAKEQNAIAPAKPATERQPATPLKVTEIDAINKLTAADKGKMVALQGRISSKIKLAPCYKLILRDDTGTIAVVLWDRLFATSNIAQKLTPGSKIKVTGKVDIFREKLQIQPGNVDQVTIVTAAPANQVFASIAAIASQNIGQVITIQGKVVQKLRKKPGFVLVVADHTGKIGVMLWDRIFKESPLPWEIQQYGFVRVTGILSAHRKRLQVQPQQQQDVKILATDPTSGQQPPRSQAPVKPPKPPHSQPAVKQPQSPAPGKSSPTNTPAAKLPLQAKPAGQDIPLAEQQLEREYLDFVAYLKKEHVGKLVQFKGKVLSRTNFPQLVKLLFQDRSGRIDVVLTQERFQNSKLYYQIGPGYAVRITAKVAEYRGKLQLQPRAPSDIQVLALPKPKAKKTAAKKEQPALAASKMADLVNAQAIGKQVTVQGKILQLQDVKIGKRLVISDNSARVDVILGKAIFADAAITKQLTSGKYVAVSGQLGQFRQRFEIKPTRPDAIKILALRPKQLPAPNHVPHDLLPIERISQINAKEHMRRWIVLSAKVIERDIIPPGLKFTLSDGDNQIELIIRHQLLQDLTLFQKCHSGSMVKVTAQVSSYRGRIQLELKRRQDFVITKLATHRPFSLPDFDSKPRRRSEQELWRPLYDLRDLKTYQGARLLLHGELRQDKQNWKLQVAEVALPLSLPGNYRSADLKGGEQLQVKGILEATTSGWIFVVKKITK